MSFGNQPYQLKDDHGNLFINKKKKKGEAADALNEEERKINDKRPDRNGKMRLNGQLFWLSAWENKTKKGDVFFSVKLGGHAPEDDLPMTQPSQHSIDKGNGYAPADKNDFVDDQIPF